MGNSASAKATGTIFDFSVAKGGAEVPLSQFKGAKAFLCVNVASK